MTRDWSGSTYVRCSNESFPSVSHCTSQGLGVPFVTLGVPLGKLGSCYRAPHEANKLSSPGSQQVGSSGLLSLTRVSAGAEVETPRFNHSRKAPQVRRASRSSERVRRLVVGKLLLSPCHFGIPSYDVAKGRSVTKVLDGYPEMYRTSRSRVEAHRQQHTSGGYSALATPPGR